LRQSLLMRHGRGAAPTEAGQVLLEHARGILHQVEHARDELARLRGTLAGRVTLGLPPSVARALAVPLVQAFGQQLPEARLSITEALSASMQEQLASGRLDIAVLYNAQPVPGLDIAPLARDELLLVQRATAPAGPTGAIALRELTRLPLVIPSRPNAIRMHVETVMAAADCAPRVALEIDGVATILELVEGGAGNAILSRHALAGVARPGAFVLRPIQAADGQPLHIPLYTAVSALRPGSATQQAALTLLRAQAGRHLGSF